MPASIAACPISASRWVRIPSAAGPDNPAPAAAGSVGRHGGAVPAEWRGPAPGRLASGILIHIAGTVVATAQRIFLARLLAVAALACISSASASAPLRKASSALFSALPALARSLRPSAFCACVHRLAGFAQLRRRLGVHALASPDSVSGAARPAASPGLARRHPWDRPCPGCWRMVLSSRSRCLPIMSPNFWMASLSSLFCCSAALAAAAASGDVHIFQHVLQHRQHLRRRLAIAGWRQLLDGLQQSAPDRSGADGLGVWRHACCCWLARLRIVAASACM